MRLSTLFPFISVLCTAMMLSSCATQWQADWEDLGLVAATGDIGILLKEAENAYKRADTATGLERSIDAYKAVLSVEPHNIEALNKLSGQYILKATAYTKSRSKKKSLFKQSMKYAERAMYTNPEFRSQVDNGVLPWDAANTLTAREAESAMIWVTALQYQFKETKWLPGKIIDAKWLQHGLLFLKQIKEVAPDFGGGAVEFSFAVSYISLPEFMGGNRKLGEQYLEKAFIKGEGWLFGQWARAKYYPDLTGKNDGIKQNLEWLLAQDIENFKDPYPWKVHFQDDAKLMLKKYK